MMLPRLNNVKLSVKMPLIVVTLIAVSLTGMAILSYFNARSVLEEGAKNRLSVAVEMRQGNIGNWHASTQNQLLTIAGNPQTREILTAFSGAWTGLSGDKTAFLQKYFSKSALAAGTGGMDAEVFKSYYARKHRSYDPYLQSLLARNHYSDLYLLDKDGNVVYSAMKEADYASNLNNRDLKTDGLAKAYHRAMAIGEGQVVFVDIAPYGALGGAARGFVSAPIISKSGSVLGVLAIQASSEIIGSAFSSKDGLGETGETLIIGTDYKLRISSLTSDPAELAKYTVSTDLVDAAVANQSGMMQTVGRDGAPVLAAYRLLTMGDFSWILVAEQDLEEMFAPAVSLRNELLLKGGGLLLFAILISIFFARGIAKPLSAVNEAMKRVAQEDYDVEISSTGRGDEIGEISSSLEDFRVKLNDAKAALAETQFKGTAFEGTSAGLMIVDQDFTIQLVNASVSKLFVEYEDEFKKVNPAFSAESIIGNNMDIFHTMPTRIRDILNDPANLPFHAEIPVGTARFSLDINSVLDNEGKQLGCVVEWNDVTASRMNDAVLKAIEANQSKAEFTPDGSLLVANDNFLNLTGGINNGQIGKKLSELVKFDSDLAQENGSIWDRVIAGESVVGKFLVDAGGGTDGTLEGAFSPVQSNKGEVIRILLVGNDVTEAQLRIEEAETIRVGLEKDQATVVEALRVGMRHLSEGDLTAEITEPFKPDYEQLRNDYNRAVGTLRDAMLKVVDNAESIRGEASDISSASDDLSRRTERQAATLEETAAALDELTVSVQSAADGAEQANQVVLDAKENAESSGAVVREAVEAMGEIQSSSSQIARIISVIDDIAFQTNLLALNAGVEAARAGEYGRGFAVVASEVRALALRSSDAAREINDLISESGQHVERGVGLVGQAGEALGQIFESVTNISIHVSEIAVSSNEQSSGLVEINTAVNQLDQVTQQNAAMFEETTAATHALTREAETLSDTMSRFKTGSQESNIVAADFQSSRNEADRPASLAAVSSVRTGSVGGNAQSAVNVAVVSAAEDDWEDF